MPYVLRQISPPGKSALADEATAAALAVAAFDDNVVKGQYLEWSNPNAKHGMGDELWTGDLKRAKKFETFEAAMECWRAQSTNRPWRPDGKANRPLTAFSVTVEQVP
jgi:hypothetical protein